MKDGIRIKHPVQQHIMTVLTDQQYARFRDMRPKNIETNLYSYHLRLLQEQSLVEKTAQGYTLGKQGIVHLAEINAQKLKNINYPNIVVSLVIQNSDGDVLLQKNTTQPYINRWLLPYGEVLAQDKSLSVVARRVLSELVKDNNQPAHHAGSCYVRVRDNEEIITSTLMHVFTFETDATVQSDSLAWVRPHKLAQYDVGPAVEQIITRTFFKDPYFFEEYEEAW